MQGGFAHPYFLYDLQPCRSLFRIGNQIKIKKKKQDSYMSRAFGYDGGVAVVFGYEGMSPTIKQKNQYLPLKVSVAFFCATKIIYL